MPNCFWGVEAGKGGRVHMYEHSHNKKPDGFWVVEAVLEGKGGEREGCAAYASTESQQAVNMAGKGMRTMLTPSRPVMLMVTNWL